MIYQKVDFVVTEGLHAIGNFINVDISYLGTFSEDRKKIFCYHYWSSSYPFNKPGHIFCDEINWWIKKLYSFEPVIINQMSDLPIELSKDLDIFNPIKAKSLLMIPMVYNDSLLGFMSLVSINKPRIWTDDIITSIKIITGIFTCVLAHKKAKKALIESKDRYKTLVDNINEYIYSFEYYDDRFIRAYHTRKCFDITGYLVDEYIKNSNLIFDIVYPDDKNKIILFFHEIKKTFKSSTIEYRILHKDGSIRWISNTCTTRIKEAKLIGIDGFIVDITKRKHFETSLKRSKQVLNDTLSHLTKAQNRLIQSEKMASLGKLSTGIAHEINNPVNFIYTALPPFKETLNHVFSLFDICKGFKYNRQQSINDIINQLKLYEEKSDFNSTKNDINCFFDIISEGANRVIKIVQSMQQFSSGNKVMDRANINEAIDSILNLLSNKIKTRISIIKDYTDNSIIECNLTQISQVLMNIISNSVHAIDNKGEIKIKTNRKKCSFCINISDTGYGINKKILNKIFDPFFTTKEVGKGVGLGLFISYELIKKHQGSINAVSETGKGTTFQIQLPIKQNDTVKP